MKDTTRSPPPSTDGRPKPHCSAHATPAQLSPPPARAIARQLLAIHTQVPSHRGGWELDLQPSRYLAPVDSQMVRAAVVAHLDESGVTATLDLVEEVIRWLKIEMCMPELARNKRPEGQS